MYFGIKCIWYTRASSEISGKVLKFYVSVIAHAKRE